MSALAIVVLVAAYGVGGFLLGGVWVARLVQRDCGRALERGYSLGWQHAADLVAAGFSDEVVQRGTAERLADGAGIQGEA